MEHFLSIPKVNDGIEVEIKDTYDFGKGSYYFGEWKKDISNGKLVRHGRGIYHFGSDGNKAGCSYISQILMDGFHGEVKMIYDDGKVNKAIFEKGELIKWL